MQVSKERKWWSCAPALTVSTGPVSESGRSASPSVPTVKPQSISSVVMAWFVVEPPEIRLDSFCFDADFHSSSQRLSLALITGQLLTFALTEEASTLQGQVQPHTDTCRRLRYIDENQVVSVGSDRAIAISDLSASTVALRLESAHNSPINAVLPIASGLLLTGDDDGVIKAWDLRTASEPKFHFVRHREQISDLALVGEFSLYSGSIEGVITEFDLRLPGFVMQSESVEEEITDFQVVANGRTIIAATSSGVLVQFQRETLGVTGRLSGHPGSVDTMAKLREDRLITGCADGYVRWVTVEPLGMLGPICEEEQREYNSDMVFSIERVVLSPDGSLLASVSHEHMVKFWDVQQAPEQSAAPADFFSGLDT